MKWKRNPGWSGGTCGATYELIGTEFVIRHCGHPTANFPYYGLRPDGSMILARNGRAFRTLAEAKVVVEGETTPADFREVIAEEPPPDPRLPTLF